jgi:hypothetical protein
VVISDAPNGSGVEIETAKTTKTALLPGWGNDGDMPCCIAAQQHSSCIVCSKNWMSTTFCALHKKNFSLMMKNFYAMRAESP